MRLIVGFPPGGGADTTARIIGPWLSQRLGQPVVIENRPGASSTLAVQAVVNSPPDGYTLLFTSFPFDLQRDLAPVSGLTDLPMVLVAHPSVPAKTVAELIALAKAKPGTISMGSFGTGSVSHLAGELFKMMAGVNLLHVPYRNIHSLHSCPAVSCNKGFCNAFEARCLTPTILMASQKPHRYPNRAGEPRCLTMAHQCLESGDKRTRIGRYIDALLRGPR